MKRFEWPLQRLLDVTAQRERAMRMELFRLSSRIAAAHREIIRRRAVLRTALAKLGAEPIGRRLATQEVVMQCSLAQEAQLSRLRGELKGMQAERAQKVALFKKTRSSRETLERLRGEALRQHTQQMLKEDQSRLDESSHATFARELINQRAAQRH